MATVKAWIQHRYTIKNARTFETFEGGKPRIMLNNVKGIIHNGFVEKVWEPISTSLTYITRKQRCDKAKISIPQFLIQSRIILQF